jgi:hypothetical protein
MQESLSALGALLQRAALARTSHASYRRAWEQWSTWCEFMSYSPWLLERDLDHNTVQIGAFVVYLWRFGMNQRALGNTHSTIRGKISAINWFHRNQLGYEPLLNARHELLLRGIRRMSDPVTKQQPLTARMLLHMHRNVDLTTARGQLQWGGLLLAYFFLLRRSEYLHIDGKRHDYILLLGQITFLTTDARPTSPWKAMVVGITLTGAKNNQFGRNEQRFHHKSGHPILCPVKAARWIVKGAAAFGTGPEHPALATSSTRGISSREISQLVKNSAIADGKDPARYSTHSIRVGGATALLNAGADRLVIKLLGRWLSNTFEEYPVLTADGTASLSRLMC